MSERRRAKQERRARRQQSERDVDHDALSFNPAWAWRMANRLALELRAGAIVVYPCPAERQARRLDRFRAVIDELERMGLVFDVRVHPDDGGHVVMLVPRDCGVAA